MLCHFRYGHIIIKRSNKMLNDISKYSCSVETGLSFFKSKMNQHLIFEGSF